MYYGAIKKYDIANGSGVRVSLFVSGCTHHCEGCFNKETWDFKYGNPYTNDTRKEILEALNHPYISGLTLIGGEPFEPSNQEVLAELAKEVKAMFPQKNIWCYTGYNFENDLLKDSGKARCQYTDELLGHIDILVDGEFQIDKKNISLKFRGSENQRIILVQQSLKQNKTILSDLNQ
ncbi:anaerobic ribonucleoside-triphosphate reductase activating protein [Porcipelethomonas sp.]|uniref:anaerobic ribonucleoside-triphosphate reductase activating protein n=1 Tax=Porcipelethomonas sp. TaxID=2981675 RepID=UPI003EF3C52B